MGKGQVVVCCGHGCQGRHPGKGDVTEPLRMGGYVLMKRDPKYRGLQETEDLFGRIGWVGVEGTLGKNLAELEWRWEMRQTKGLRCVSSLACVILPALVGAGEGAQG